MPVPGEACPYPDRARSEHGLAARILSFRTVPFSAPMAAPARRSALAPALQYDAAPDSTLVASRSARRSRSNSCKVLLLSRNMRHRHPRLSRPDLPSMLSKVQAEMGNHYVEIETGGLSLARLGCIYLAGAREARDRFVSSVRALFRLSPIH